jgi:c-di-GMP-binding flagellar brake protein YcgR
MEKENVRIVKAFTRDISAGGLCFETEQPITARTVLSLEIYQPLRKPEGRILSIPVQAKVKWVISTNTATRYQGSNKYRLGVEFVKIGGRERKEIAGYVKDELKQ